MNYISGTGLDRFIFASRFLVYNAITSGDCQYFRRNYYHHLQGTRYVDVCVQKHKLSQTQNTIISTLNAYCDKNIKNNLF